MDQQYHVWARMWSGWNLRHCQREYKLVQSHRAAFGAVSAAAQYKTATLTQHLYPLACICWETVLCCTVASLYTWQARHSVSFVSDYVFKDVCILNNLERECVSLWSKRQICLQSWGSDGASLRAQLVKNPPAMWETWVRSLGWEDPL